MSEAADTPTGATISRVRLYELVWAQPLGAVGELIGLSGSGVAKLCDRLDVPRPSRRYWLRGGDPGEVRPPLPPAPPDVAAEVVVGAETTARYRGSRNRLPLEERRQQLLQIAARQILEEGIPRLTLKSLARTAGMSEAHVHHCFKGRVDLLVELARREISELEALRVARVLRGTDHTLRVALSTVSYLQEADARGPLLQLLLRVPEVRQALKGQRKAIRDEGRQRIVGLLEREDALPRDIATASLAALAGVTVRAGNLVAFRKVDLGMAERLCLALVINGTLAVRAERGSNTLGGWRKRPAV